MIRSAFLLFVISTAAALDYAVYAEKLKPLLAGQ
jgi:hypothetical protein